MSRDFMEASSPELPNQKFPLKLLLFIDKRPAAEEQVRRIRQYLKSLAEHFAFNLEVVDIGEQPYLAEHYKLVASPALIKLAPMPQQMLTGSDIIPQLERWWPKWYREAENSQQALEEEGDFLAFEENGWLAPSSIEVSHDAELMKMSDEIFRLNQVKDELYTQLLFKDRILAMLAHDLRNPLTAASIAIETLEMGHVPNPQTGKTASLSPELTRHLLKHAKTQMRAINRMIADILQAAKGAVVDVQIQAQELQLQGICREVVESFQQRFEDNQLQVITDIPQDLPTVYADGGQIRRVLVNLLDNAIKYTPKGGQIELTALHRTTQKVQVTIHDTGPGIPPENRETVFEESFRLQRDQGKDGYGLGLALCQRIIRAHYGQIWVDSKAGEGSYFYFTLPVFRA